MIPISTYQAGAVMGFLTGVLLTIVVSVMVFLYFQAKQRRRRRSSLIGKF